VAAFKQQNAVKYTAKFSSEPSVRPTYIPSSARVGNTTYNISYNRQYGGYGYYDNTLGRWMLYDALANTAFLALEMNRNHYVVAQDQPVVVVHRHYGGFLFAMLVVAIIISIVIITMKSVE